MRRPLRSAAPWFVLAGAHRATAREPRDPRGALPPPGHGPSRRRLVFLALGMFALLAALWTGLARLGWTPFARRPGPVAFHGPLMVSGFLGTVIALERATALGRTWMYAAPACTGLGAVALVTGMPGPTGEALIVAGSAVALALFGHLLSRGREVYMATLTAGAAAWLGGNVLWLAGWPVQRVVPWWIAFLVLTIAGERLELTRLLALPVRVRRRFVACVGIVAAGMAASTLRPDAGMRVMGAGLLALAAWLARHDIARRTIHEHGLARFMAACLLSGYVWLAVGGVLALRDGLPAAGERYDAILHAVFLGFVFAMIFGHAPVIFPSVLGVPVVWEPRFWLHLMLLHVTLAVRITADELGLFALRRWAGLLNAAVILLFLASMAAALAAAARARRHGGRPGRAGPAGTGEAPTPAPAEGSR